MQGPAKKQESSITPDDEGCGSLDPELHRSRFEQQR